MFSDGLSHGANTVAQAGPCCSGLRTPAPSQTHVLNAPAQTCGHSACHLRFREVLFSVLGRGTKQPLSAASTGTAEWSFWNPLGSDRRDPNTLAPNRRKLGRLQRARQELVRVPESNTKYGGKRGKPEGDSPARLAQVSVSPQRFPREKICDGEGPTGFTPLFTGEVFLWGVRLLIGDSRSATGTQPRGRSGIRS